LAKARAYAGGGIDHRFAERLCIAPSTVRTHLARMFADQGVVAIEIARMKSGLRSKN
jgi:hypothetical protein